MARFLCPPLVPVAAFLNQTTHETAWKPLAEVSMQSIELGKPVLIVTAKEESDALSPSINKLTDGWDRVVTRVLHSSCVMFVISTKEEGIDGIEVYKKPVMGSCHCTPSPPSHAMYGASVRRPYLGMYAQILERPRRQTVGHTSSHFHQLQREWWLVTAGDGVLLRRPCNVPDAQWEKQFLSPGVIASVEPNTMHQLWTFSSLETCLVMTGHPEGISKSDHFYVEPPTALLLMA